MIIEKLIKLNTLNILMYFKYINIYINLKYMYIYLWNIFYIETTRICVCIVIY